MTPPCCIPSVSVGVFLKLPLQGQATTLSISYSCLGIPPAAGGQVMPPSPDFQVFRAVILSFKHSCNARLGCQVYLLLPRYSKSARWVSDAQVFHIARWGSEGSLKLSSGLPSCILVPGQVFLQRQVWVVTPRSSKRGGVAAYRCTTRWRCDTLLS